MVWGYKKVNEVNNIVMRIFVNDVFDIKQNLLSRFDSG